MEATNAYSPTWFDLFLRSIPPAQTEREVAFLTRHLPQPAFCTVLDLCCGWGRHSRLLAARGYRVTGVDRDAAALAEARRRAAGLVIDYRAGDLRDLTGLPGPFDAVLNLWQSFGYFDDATNERVLAQMAGCLRPTGRLVLDLYYRDFFVQHQGEQRFERAGVPIIEQKQVVDHRLTVSLIYEAGGGDVFTWRLYTPAEIIDLGARHGLRLLHACTTFDETQPPTTQQPRMQIVFERSSAPI